ncbi:hypothetical protein [Chlorogloeopsis sp. ULAP02]|uniref:hypothetical protein n=1 Tax=Chlorogloeopsis sp. ULAP02 TaxID=3107926 RepID=UPI00313760A9
MSKFVSATLIATALLMLSARYSSPTFAGTCASKCGPRSIQFKPGQSITLEVVNNTYNTVNLQKPYTTNPIILQPGQKLQLEQGDGTEPNISLLFWNEAGLPLKATVSKANFATLRVEFRPTWYAPGDRAIYILDDGKVNML